VQQKKIRAKLFENKEMRDFIFKNILFIYLRQKESTSWGRRVRGRERERSRLPAVQGPRRGARSLDPGIRT